MRIELELPYWDYKAVVVDLTYSPEALAKLNEENEIRHLSNPQKYPIRINSFGTRERHNLQRRLKYKLDKVGKDFSLITAPEYGGKRGRLHVHAIILGLTMDDQKLIWEAWGNSIWDAFHIQPISQKQVSYITKYLTKMGDSKNWQYEHPYQEKPRIRFGNGKSFENDKQNKRRGYGYRFAIENAEKLRREKTIRYNQHAQTLPRYIGDKAGVDYTSDLYQERFDEKELEYTTMLKKYEEVHGHKMDPDHQNDFRRKQIWQKTLNRQAKASLYDPVLAAEYRNQRQTALKKANPDRANMIKNVGEGEQYWLDWIRTQLETKLPWTQGHGPPNPLE